nr:RHS repeat-associated core domain-containing protein [Leptospira santarosai]
MTGAESPVSEKRNRINHVEYSKILKYETHFLRKPPYILITKHSKHDYGYDGIGRLTSANGSYLGIAEGNLSRRFQQSFGYAKNGNLTSKRIHDPSNGNITDEWSYQYTNHQVTNIDSSRTGADTLTLQYDANGNLTRQRDNVKDLTKRISVDSQDRITQIQDGNNAILGSYWYDESGFRIRRSALEEKNNVFANVEILYPSKFYGLEFIESENVITSVNNVYLNGVRIAAMNEAGALAYYLTDQVDSVSHVLDDEGNTLSQIQYQPYGETFVQRGDLNFSPKYNSQELDRESGFYFYNARYYDPGIARFTSADTIIDGEFDTQGWNRFSYVKGNPIGAKDPSGHEIFTVAREYSNTHVSRPAETTGKNFYLVEKDDVKNGLGLSKLAEKALSYENKKTTDETVKKKMQEILENNPNAFGKNKLLKSNARVEVGKYQGENPNAPNIFDSMIGSPGKALKAFKYGGSYLYDKATGKNNETEEIKQLRKNVNGNSEKIFNQYENRLQKLGVETRTKGFPFNVYQQEGKQALKPDVNSKGNLMFKGYQGEVIITNEKAAKYNK